MVPVDAIGVPPTLDQSDAEWAVIVLPRSLGSKFSGRIAFSPDYADDGRLVAAATAVPSPPPPQGRGPVPRREYHVRLAEFSRVVGTQRRNMALIQWVGFLLLVLGVPWVVERLLGGVDGRGQLTVLLGAALVVPLASLAHDRAWQIRTQRATVREIFAPWRARYGITDVDWRPGSRRRPPRLAFRLTPKRAGDK